MKKNKLFSMLLSLALAAGFPSCSDDDVLPDLPQPETLENTRSTYNSLSFEWAPVDGAIQYGYQLVDPAGVGVKSDVIQTTQVKISGLEADTEYTLKVWPFAGLGVNYNTPAPIEVKGKTEPIIKLANPVPTVTIEDNKAIIEWPRVENAATYKYTLKCEEAGYERSAEPSGVKLTFRNLPEGEYVFNVQACTTVGGFSNSDVVTETFRIGEVEPDVWEVTAVYQNDYTGDFYDVQFLKNEDGTYTIKKFWGYEGYDLNFEVDDEGYVTFLNAEKVEGYTSYAWLLGSEYYWLWTYIKLGNADYSPMFKGDQNGGEFWFGYSEADEDDDAWHTDYMSWGTVNE